jgi:GT2 family glycosyltransferase
MKLSIIIINYNTQKLLEACVALIKKNLQLTNYEIIVVDNDSQNFSEQILKKTLPKITIIRSKQNLGFGKANNLAAKQAQGEYIWFLNSDTKLPSNNHVEDLVTFLDIHKEYAAIGPLVVDKKGTPQLSQFGYFPAVWRMVVEKFARRQVNKKSQRANHWAWLNADYLPLMSRDVDWISGAAMMVRKEMFNDVGGFDNQYFLYYEDVDLCRKFNANNLKIRFFNDAKIVHYEGASTSSIRNKKHLAYAGQDTYFKRWGSPVSRFFLKQFRTPYAKKWQKP